MPPTAPTLSETPETVPFATGQAVVREGRQFLRMAFYGIFRAQFHGKRLGEVVATNQRLAGAKMMLTSYGIAQVVKTDVPDQSVVVDVIEVPLENVLDSVDYTERHPHWYVRTWLPDQLGGVWCYLMPNARVDKGSIEVPHGDYTKLRGS